MIIRNESMRLLLISILVAEATAEPGDQTGATTVPPLSVQEIAQLAKLGKPELSVTFDSTSLQRSLQTLRHVQGVEAQLQYFLQHGATNSMLAELFHISANAAKAKRKAYEAVHPVEGKRRRPSMPNSATREKIHHVWYALRGAATQPPKPQDYRSLHDTFPALSLASLYAVVNEFDD